MTPTTIDEIAVSSSAPYIQHIVAMFIVNKDVTDVKVKLSDTLYFVEVLTDSIIFSVDTHCMDIPPFNIAIIRLSDKMLFSISYGTTKKLSKWRPKK